jgi:hypothetical protein
MAVFVVFCRAGMVEERDLPAEKRLEGLRPFQPFYGGRQVMAMALLSYCPLFFIPSGSDLDAI